MGSVVYRDFNGKKVPGNKKYFLWTVCIHVSPRIPKEEVQKILADISKELVLANLALMNESTEYIGIMIRGRIKR